MILKHKLFEKYKDYEFRIDIGSDDKPLVSKGDTVKRGTDLILKRGNSMAYSFYIPEQIGCHISKIQDYITCIDGQLVDEGDTLAEKVKMGGLTVNKLVSPTTGVVDLTRIKNGYLDILGEDQEKTIKSTFKGEVVEVNPLDGLIVKSDAFALDLLSMSNYFDKDDTQKLSGEFICINDGQTVSLRTQESNYEGKIVFVGKHLHVDLLQDLFEKGAKFVLTCSMDYEDFRRQGLPVGIISGFGDIYTGDEIVKKISSINGSYAVVDWSEKQIFFVSDTINENNVNIFVSMLPGNIVISRSLMNYGMLGKIIGIEQDTMYVSVEWENKAKSLINVGNVEFVSI